MWGRYNLTRIHELGYTVYATSHLLTSKQGESSPRHPHTSKLSISYDWTPQKPTHQAPQLTKVWLEEFGWKLWGVENSSLLKLWWEISPQNPCKPGLQVVEGFLPSIRRVFLDLYGHDACKKFPQKIFSKWWWVWWWMNPLLVSWWWIPLGRIGEKSPPQQIRTMWLESLIN